MFPPAGTYSVPVMKMKRRILILPVLLFALALLRFPQEAAQAVREGLLLCFETVVPSLFPFFVVVSLLIQLGAAGALQRLFAPFMGPLFHLRGLCAAPLIAGLVGGYPAGARTAAELVRSGQLSREEGERCLGFVNNCGPAFILSYVGAGVLHSSRAGVWLYLIHVFSALLTGMLLCRLLPEGRRSRASAPPSRAEPQPVSLSAALPTAVTGSLTSVLNICGFVVLFRAVVGVIPAALPAAALGAVEMVSGVAALSPGPAGFVTAAAILGWGGLSVHCQTAAVAGPLRLRHHWLGKGVQSLLSLALAAGAAQFLFP